MADFISGGLNPDSRRARLHANRMYDEIRKRRTDFLNISKNTGFSIEQIQIIKNYLFKDKHYLSEDINISERFFPVLRLQNLGGDCLRKMQNMYRGMMFYYYTMNCLK